MKPHLAILSLALLSAPLPAVGTTEPGETAPAPALAPTARFNLTPLRVDIASGESGARMIISNRDRRRLDVQLRVFEWRQVDGRDEFVRSTDIVVSPSIIQIAPGDQQTFHVIPQIPLSATNERRYRVVLDQLPDAQGAQASAANTRVRMTVPLFAGGEAASPHSLQFSADSTMLRVTNTGQRTAKVDRLALHVPGRDPLELKPIVSFGYVFGQQTITYALPAQYACPSRTLHLTGIVDRKPFDAQIEAECD